jgi:hypothetical protein
VSAVRRACRPWKSVRCGRRRGVSSRVWFDVIEFGIPAELGVVLAVGPSAGAFSLVLWQRCAAPSLIAYDDARCITAYTHWLIWTALCRSQYTHERKSCTEDPLLRCGGPHAREAVPISEDRAPQRSSACVRASSPSCPAAGCCSAGAGHEPVRPPSRSAPSC